MDNEKKTTILLPEVTLTAKEILEKLKDKVTATYSGELWQATKAALAVITSLSLKGRTNPLTLIFEGASGRGKSTVINMCAPDQRKSTRQYLYRLDKFTPASFVTQAANVGKGEISGVDLLPKLKNKVLITKELAPLFRNREESLKENFGTLTAVLDGKGHVTSSGTHGTRGYEGDYVFNWIGGTTPIPAHTDKIMAQLGNRLLRYEIIGEAQSENDLVEFLLSYEASTIEDECQTLANDFVEAHFAKHALNSVEQSSIKFPEESAREIARLATLLAQARVEVTLQESTGEYVAGEPEGPNRPALLLRIYGSGFTLLDGKDEIDGETVASVRHIAFSSIPRSRRGLLRAVLTNGGRIDAAGVESILRVSRPTATDAMKELAATGIVEFTKGVGSRAATVCLAKRWRWLLADGGEELAKSEMPLCASPVVEI